MRSWAIYLSIFTVIDKPQFIYTHKNGYTLPKKCTCWYKSVPAVLQLLDCNRTDSHIFYTKRPITLDLYGRRICLSKG